MVSLSIRWLEIVSEELATYFPERYSKTIGRRTQQGLAWLARRNRLNDSKQWIRKLYRKVTINNDSQNHI